MHSPPIEKAGPQSFYRAFEDRHRGSRDLIKQRLRQYTPFLTPLLSLDPQGDVLDLGCGCGEWLEVTTELGFRARGVDLDQGMLTACAELGLNASQQDLSSALKTCADESLCVVSAFHVVEHIPFDTLLAAVREALRVLVPGGLLILETPNPENLVVGACNFYLDPTHIRPLPPLLLEFCADHIGFHRAKIIRLQENPEIRTAGDIQLIDVLSGVSPDYAIVAQKLADDAILQRFDTPFHQDYGLNLGLLAQRFDAAKQQRLDEAKTHADHTLSMAKAELSSRMDKLAEQFQHEHALAEQLTALLNTEQTLRAQWAAAQQALIERERALAEQLIAMRAEEQDRIEAARHAGEARAAQLQQELDELHQRLDAQRAQSAERETQLRAQAEQQIQTQQVAALTQAEQLRAQWAAAQQALIERERALAEQWAAVRAEEQQRSDAARQAEDVRLAQWRAEAQAHNNALHDVLNQHTAYAQALAERIAAMQSTWWWRVSMLWRRAASWPAIASPAWAKLPCNPVQDAQARSSPQTENVPDEADTASSRQRPVGQGNCSIGFAITFAIRERPSMPVQHITELFTLDGREFVTEAYRNLLRREPDEHGLAYYLGRLSMGYGKAAVITQLAQSPECRPLDEIKGLKKLVADERRAQHWLLGLFGQRQRLEQKWQMGLNALALHNQQWALLHDALGKQAQTLGQIAQQIEANTQHIANWQAKAFSQEKVCDEAPRLPLETVRQCFVDILGREPESEEAIKHHARLPSTEVLQENLIHSEEFQHKLLALPEYARLLFKRQIQQKTALQGV